MDIIPKLYNIREYGGVENSVPWDHHSSSLVLASLVMPNRDPPTEFSIPS